MTVLHCSTCGEEREFETPPCPDGHADCPERVCTGCGAALLVGTSLPELPARRSAARSAA